MNRECRIKVHPWIFRVRYSILKLSLKYFSQEEIQDLISTGWMNLLSETHVAKGHELVYSYACQTEPIAYCPGAGLSEW
jgi:hypothetical protein